MGITACDIHVLDGLYQYVNKLYVCKLCIQAIEL